MGRPKLANPKPRVSGPGQSKDARRAAGRVRLDVWLEPEAASALQAYCDKRRGVTKADALHEILLRLM